MSKRMYHPCHKLSVPSAKLFWCRHCMQMFEDAISRWKHSKKCHASPGYKPKDQDARVVQLYVKPDKVSYTSNVTPGQTVYHKPHVKKTSTDLKCVICGTKFYSLYDMRRHVKEPCQKSDNSVASTQIELSDTEDDTESFSSLKIRRVEAEDEDKSSAETALSVLAEASKHVESLSNAGEVILEQVIEEVPQILERLSQPAGSTFAWYQLANKLPEENNQQQQQVKEVVVAYPRPQVRSELGTVVIALQSEDGNQLLHDSIDLETLQECVKDTAITLPIGQIIQIQLENSDKYRHFVVGYQGIIWPVEENSLISATNHQEQTQNTVLDHKVSPTTQETEIKQEPNHNLPTSSLAQILTNSLEKSSVEGVNGLDFEVVNGQVVDSSSVFSQEVVVASEEPVQQEEALKYSQQANTDLGSVENNTRLVLKENSAQLVPNKLENFPPGQNFENLFQVPLVQNQVQPVGDNQECTAISEQPGVQEALAIEQTEKQEVQAIPSHSTSESLVEALLRGSVIISQTTAVQEQTRDHTATMASGEHVVEDLFGFAELTGETISPAIDASYKNHLIVDKSPEDSTKFHFEKEKIKRDTDEVVVPILFEKSGVKKFKVLARHQVEDDEDIKRPVASKRESPNCEEQRKENIDIDLKSENVHKHKSDAKGNVKRPKVNRIEKGKEHSIRNLKSSLNARKFKGKLSKIPQRKHDEKANTNVEKKEKMIKSSISKDPRAVNYEFHDDSDSNIELHKVKSKVEDVVGSEKVKPCNTTVAKIEDSCKSISLEKANPLKIECHVKLRRDPSIENFYKSKSDNDSKDSDESECSDSESKTGDAKTEEQCTKQSDSAEGRTVDRQNSLEESLLKAANMVYNVDIQVRKSGRLKSAKCASRYRGDYGIRVDTYKQLINKTSNSCSITESSEHSVSSEIDEVVRNKADEKQVGKERVETLVELSNKENESFTDKTDEDEVINEREVVDTSAELRNERPLDSMKTDHVETEHCEYKDSETVVCDDTVDIPAETCKTESSSEEFTALKEPLANKSDAESISRIEPCSETEHLIEKCSEVSNGKDNETKSQTEIVIESKEETDTDLLNCDTANDKEVKVQLCKVSEVETENGDSAGSHLPHPESSESMQKEHSEAVDNCNCQTENEIVRSNVVCDSKMIVNEVPCCNLIEGNLSCACDIRQENNTLESVKNSRSELSDNEVKAGIMNEVLTGSDTNADSKTDTEIHSQLTKENINETLLLLQSRAKMSKDCTGYVHSVGKSVNKMEKRIKSNKPVSNIAPSHTENEITPEPSPIKDPAKVLETLRQKLFESAGADVLEADKVPKQFESKLISSKQRQCEDCKSSVSLDLPEKDRQIRDSDSTSGRSGKSTPRCSTPRQDSSREILEEVALSLDVLHQVKRRFENPSKVGPSKRQRFEEKTFLLRSMMKKSDDVDGTKTSQQDIIVEDEKPLIAARIAERTRSSRSSAESSASKSDKYKISRKSNVESSDVKIGKKETEKAKPIHKPKPVKCSACSHIFKTKELLRKHFPCRIRQTRTWSQNKLRPNRAVKRIENNSKMFVCKLPKSGKPEPSKPRPQLLIYRKTKFRRVKGKRRRKLYQLIQELRQKRMPVKWHHLSVVYEDLSFKEQCLYKLGLSCVGHASEGLEKYTAEEITVFEQHRAKEKWLMEDAQTFVHSIPDTLDSLTDLNISTELSTDNQESDFLSPKHVINFPQENILNRNCDTDDSTKEEKGDGAKNETSVVKIHENDLDSDTAISPIISENIDPIENNVNIPPCYAFYPGLDEKETDTSYEEIVDLAELPEKMNADTSVQEYLESFRSSKINTDSDNNVVCSEKVMTHVETSPRSQNIAQLETFTAVEEGIECLEETLEFSQDCGVMISVKGNLVDNPLRKASVTEINVRTTDIEHINETNKYESSTLPSSDKYTGVSQEELMNESGQQKENKTSEIEWFSVKKSVNSETSLSCTLPNNESETDLNLCSKSVEMESNNVQKARPLELSKDTVNLSVLPENVTPCAERDTGKSVSEPDNQQTYVGKSREGIAERTAWDVETQKQVRKFSPRKKYAIVPDIELYHQTATIDDKYLADTPLAVQHKRTSDKYTRILPSSSNIKVGVSKEEEIIETDFVTATKSDSDLDPDLIYQASGILKDILGDVEQSVNDSKDTHLPELEKYATRNIANDIANDKSNAVFSKVTNVNLNVSPVKGILKNAGPRKEYAGLSPLKLTTVLSNGEISEKSPGKKKIDFRTYAKRKGMIKEKDENEKECTRSETHYDVEDTKIEGIGNEKDENDIECMRSEPSHEIEDGLLGRLLDAVNLIDSIIEEHKYQSDHEEDDDTFNAITPEMAFEAAMSNKRVENINPDAVSKPYDIESVFPYSEVDKVIDVDKLHLTGINDVPESNGITRYKPPDFERNPANQSISINVLSDTEFICDKSLPNVYPVTSSDFNHIEDIETNISSQIENDEDHKEVEESIERTGVLTRKESPSGCESPSQQTATEFRYEITENKADEIRIDNLDEIVNPDSIEEKKEECETDLNDQEMTRSRSTDQLSSEEINICLKSSVSEDELLGNIEQEKRNKNDDDIYKSSVKDTDSEDLALEDTYMEERDEHNDDEIMKSPEHIPKKRKRKLDNATSIKESNRDFTIKYEMNGIVIKEDLLTGDKNVVENSSPFRSSAESDSNFDQSSLSELDVSSVTENDTNLGSNAAVEEAAASAGNSSFASGKLESHSTLSSNDEDKSENKISSEDSYILSSEDTIAEDEQENVTDDDFIDHELEDPTPRLFHEVDQISDIENQIEMILEKSEVNIDTQETEKDANLSKENTLYTSIEEEESLDVCDNCDPEMSTENVPSLEMEPLLCADVQFLKKVSDDHSVGSPPVLEKVEVSDNSISEQDEENTSPETPLTTEGPPLLEPEELEEIKDNAKQDQHESVHQGRQERHFLDILGMVSNEAPDSAIFPDLENSTENTSGTGSKRSGKPLLEELYSEESTLNDSIGRHFSDVTCETVEAPKTPKSKLQFLFDKSERGEVTLAQIKDVLSPFSKKGKKKSLPKESLLKIKSGIADLLSNVKKPVRKDPTWLKRDALSDYSRKKKIKKKSSYEEEKRDILDSSSDESAQEDFVNISSDSSESTDLKTCKDKCDNKNPSKGFVADTIIQMLDSLEDKGSVADNMSNLLDILAEHLGFLGKGKASEFPEDLSSDSDYSCSEETSFTNSSSTENTQKELIADYLEEGEQPPSLDDIPTACNLEMSWKKGVTETIKGDQENFIEAKEAIVGASTESRIDSFVEKSTQKLKHLKDVAPFNLENSDESLTVTTEHAKDDKCKATTIFKSITELNSIETDEESNTDESFDPVSMSARLSDLKDTNTWEFNSDYDSDQEQSDNFETEFENDFESQNEHSVTEGNGNAPSAIESDNSKGTSENTPPAIADCQYQGGQKDDGIKSGVLIPLKLFSKETNSLVFSKLDEKTKYTENTEEELSFDLTSKEYAIKLNSTLVEDRIEKQFSPSSGVDVDSDSDDEHASDVNLSSVFDTPAPQNILGESLLPSSSTECSIANSGSEKRYTSFMKKIEEAAAIFSPGAEVQENVFNNDLESEEDGNAVDCQSLKIVKDPEQDNKDEDIFSEGEDLNNDSRHAGAVEKQDTIKDSADVSAEIAGNEKLPQMSKGVTENTHHQNSLKTIDCRGDLKLISELEDLQEEQYKPKTIEETESRLLGLHTDNLDDKSMHDNNHITDTFVTNDLDNLHKLENDEDTNETVTYDEQEEAKTDFAGSVNNVSDTNKDIDITKGALMVRDDLKKSRLENSDSQEVNLFKEADKKEIESIPMSPSSPPVVKEIKAGGSKQETHIRESNIFSNLQMNYSPEIVLDNDEHLTKKRSTSFNIDNNEYPDNFCESIAEKVKRKQRERSKSVCYSFNPWLYYSAAYVREVTKPAKKEISVFRSSILEKRAREKSYSPEKEDTGCSSRKKRNSSVPKEAKFGTNQENTCTDDGGNLPERKSIFQLRPCSVAIPKLTDDIIHRYTNRKRKSEEDTSSENRPPIKVTIKLSQIVYPPNSPYGSTSTSSDNYRSGYESCSEESEIEVNEPDEENEFEIKQQKQIIQNSCDAEDMSNTNGSDERSVKAETSSREPLKIKMRTLLTKMNSCEEGNDVPKSAQEINLVSEFSGSFNESSNETNVEVSAGELELIESEVLHDIEQECQKVKSREMDVMFYLSESDDENEPSTSRKRRQQLVKPEQEICGNFGTRALSISSIQAECGESDVDLSDSDTDSEIQQEIDKILNSKSSEDLSSAIAQNDEKDTSHPKLKKGKSSLMKMIVSDLRLSESESESEVECSMKFDGKSTPEEKGCEEQIEKAEVECSIKFDEKSMPEEKACKEQILKADECITEQADENITALPEMRDDISFNISENNSENKVIEKRRIHTTQSNDKDLFPRISQVMEENVQESMMSARTLQCNKDMYPIISHLTENSVQEPLSQTLPSVSDSSSNQVEVSSQDQECFSPRIDEEFVDKELDVPEELMEPLDLSMPSKERVMSSSYMKNELNGVTREEMRASSNDIEEKKFPIESLPLSSSELQVIETNHFSDSQSFYSNGLMSPSASKQEETDKDMECSQFPEGRDNENPDFNYMVMAHSQKNGNAAKNLDNADNTSRNLDGVDDEIELPDICEEFETHDKEEGLKCQVPAPSEVSSDNITCIESESTKEENVVDMTCDVCADLKAENCLNSPNDESENTVISEEETKEKENENAVKNLEEDIFHDVQPVQNCTEEDMVYYAVELSDDLETNEAVVNLETVELIEGPIIIENNDTHEENILDTSIIQSHVNDQFQLGNETLNEQIVETLNEVKLPSEVRISSAFESMTQIENPVFYPTVNDVKSKYLYGINEDSQSSNEVVEELVTEIVNENTVLQEQVTIENPQIFSEVSSAESPNNRENYTDVIPVSVGNSYISESAPERENIAHFIPVSIESSHVNSESSVQKEKFINVQKTLSEPVKVSNVTDQNEMYMDTTYSTDNDMRNEKVSFGTECTSYRVCDKWTDRDSKSLPLNISEFKMDTRQMCSQPGNLIQFKADNLSHGYDLISNKTVVKDLNDADQNMCVQSSNIENSRLAVESVGTSSAQEYESCAMVIEHSDDNDYIITQNENFDDDDDDDVAMEIV